MTPDARVSVVIPSYNGRALLSRGLKCIGSEVASARILVVDDASDDDSVAMLRNEFPGVTVVARRINGGFSAAVNEGIRAADSEFVVLLNNDVEVTPGFLDPILPLFESDDVFAVSPRILTPSLGGLDDGAKIGEWHHGMLWSGHQQGVHEVRPMLFTSGCASVYRRRMLEQLGGFDEAYSPFYWEDVDLSYRAWKRGWRSLYQPQSTVSHEHSSTIVKLDARYTASVKARNSLFFIWRNIEDEHLLRLHRMWLPLVLLKRAALGDSSSLEGWKSAFTRRREAVAARRLDSEHRVISDRKIFETVGVRVPK